MRKKFISESTAIKLLNDVRAKFATRIRTTYEPRAKPCSICEKPGSCCLDDHFVNVRISRLEAVAIRKSLDELDIVARDKVNGRIARAIDKYGLTEQADAAEGTYSCPLFERGIGCLVHSTAKPLPCISHACYENKEDLPPDEVLADGESAIAALNQQAYGRPGPLMSIPVAVERTHPSGVSRTEALANAR